MLILDTDHFSEMMRSSASGLRLEQRLAATDQDVATTIITLEEQARGWLSRIKQAETAVETIEGYAKLQRLFEVAANWRVLPWDERASSTFEGLRALRPRIGTLDLRIAAIVMACDGQLLSRNLKDFSRIPNLAVEDWLSS